MAIADFRDDIDWNAIDYVDRASDWDIPTLIFHGDVDGTVPLSVSRTSLRRIPSWSNSS